jgi:hypothetical protein
VTYIALIHHNPAAWEALSQPERDAFNSDADVFLETVTRSGTATGVIHGVDHISSHRRGSR